MEDSGVDHYFRNTLKGYFQRYLNFSKLFEALIFIYEFIYILFIFSSIYNL